MSDFDAFFDIRTNRNYNTLFRGTNVLEVQEPAEPDNIIWRNIEISPMKRFIYTFISRIIVLATFIASYFAVIKTQEKSPIYLSLAG